MKRLNAGLMLLAAVLCILVVLRVVDHRRKEAAQEQRLKDAQQKVKDEELGQALALEIQRMERVQRELVAQEVKFLPGLIPSVRQDIQNRLAGLPKEVRDAVDIRAGAYLVYLDSMAPKAAELMRRGVTLPEDPKELDALDQDITVFMEQVQQPRLELENLLANPSQK